MSYFWFNNDADIQKNVPCFCDFCTDCIPDARKEFAPYWRAGLKLKEGTIVNLAMVKQTMQIALNKV